MNQARSDSQHQVLHTQDPHEVEAATAGTYLPNHLYPLERGDLDVHLDMLSLGSVTVGRLSYGVEAGLQTDESGQYLVSVPLHGQAVSRATNNEPEPMGAGQAAVFMPDLPADALWMHDSTQLFLLVPKAMLESEVEQLLGTSLGRPITFERRMDLSAPAAQGLREALAALVSEMDGGTGPTQANVARQLERILVDGLLVGHEHNYSEALAHGRWFPSSHAIRRATDLLGDLPANDWSTTGLEREVHLGVRALEDGFVQQVGAPPMTYLRQVRLRTAQRTLRDADPGTTTVPAVAAGLGFPHLGRFAAAYRNLYGEMPSTTLRRE